MRLIDADAMIADLLTVDPQFETMIQWCCTVIDAQPTIEPERKTGWIPCSERLPDKPNVYTVTDHAGRVVRYVYNDNEFSREYWKRCAKAWMPLPEAYREVEHEND